MSNKRKKQNKKESYARTRRAANGAACNRSLAASLRTGSRGCTDLQTLVVSLLPQRATPPPRFRGLFLRCHVGMGAGEGNLEVLQWIIKRGSPWSSTTCAMAAAGGHLELLRWAWKQGCPWDRMSPCIEATRCGRLEVLQWQRRPHHGVGLDCSNSE
ncbi:Ankyrin repeat domain containing protein [Balamuthia mandrillaris]